MTVKPTESGQTLEAAHAEARTLWPAIDIPLETYRDYVKERTQAETSDLGATELQLTELHLAELHLAELHLAELHLAELHLADLYLACALAQGDTAAIEIFEREHMPRVSAAIARIAKGTPIADETKQVVRELLFVGKRDRRPAITEYTGRGALRSWVKVIAVREAMRLARHQGNKGTEVQVEEDRLFDFFAPKSDPELSYIKDKAVAEFRTALLATIAELPRRQRTILRLSVLDGLSIDEIAPMYDVHRATVARWLEKSRDAIFTGTRQRLRKQLELGNSEVDSLIRAARSRIDVTLGNVLDTSD